MTFTLESAKKLVEHYKFLIGQFIDKEHLYKITDNVFAPADPEQYSKFSIAYIVEKNNVAAIQHSGFDSENVRVLLLHHDFTLLLHYDLDSYLDKNNLDKIY